MTDLEPHGKHRAVIAAAVIGAIGAIVAALIAAFLGQKADIISISLGPQPTVTVVSPGPVVSVPGPTVTATETVGAGSNPTGGSGDVVHLADATVDTRDLLTIRSLTDHIDLKMAGTTFDYGWTTGGSPYYSKTIMMGVNVNHEYSRFNATIGLAGSSLNNSGKLVVLADGTEVCGGKISNTTKHYYCNIAVNNIQLLEFVRYPSSGGEVTYGVGDPVLTK